MTPLPPQEEPPRPPTPTELFTNRPPTEHQGEILDQITQVMIEAADQVVELLPASRYRALAMTKLEEASMWAKKAAVFTVTEQVYGGE